MANMTSTRTERKKISFKPVIITGLLFHIAVIATTYHCNPILSLTHDSQAQGETKTGVSQSGPYYEPANINSSSFHMQNVNAPVVSYLHTRSHRAWDTEQNQKYFPSQIRLPESSYPSDSYRSFLHHLLATTAYLGWICYAIAAILYSQSFFEPQPSLLVDVLSASALSVSMFALYANGTAASCYAYATFSIYFWRRVLNVTVEKLRSTVNGPGNITGPCWRGGLLVVTLQIMNMAYKYTHLWSAGLLLIGVAWPLLGWPERALRRYGSLLLAWITTCVFTAAISLTEAPHDMDQHFTVLAAACAVALGLVMLFVDANTRSDGRWFTLTQMGFIMGSVVVKSYKTVPTIHRLSSWLILFTSILLPLMSLRRTSVSFIRLGSLSLASFIPIALLSNGQDAFFFISYSILLLLWTKIEPLVRASQDKGAEQSSSLEDLRIAVFVLFFIQLAFFGSVGSSSMASINRLLPDRHSLWLFPLLALKISGPYVILSASTAALNEHLNLPPFKLLLVAMTMASAKSTTLFLNGIRADLANNATTPVTHFITSQMLLLISAGVDILGEALLNNLGSARLPSEGEAMTFRT
ncbi:Phosphatidylinositolglycan class N-domain-containing protein [Cristinia sonorae]|uniref:GPI ethanolamine phosphate transferase 1 n=1 Tax=Cristinia sonorae TaxID=1940300 RepID=A0A8K0UEH5_9AGAR|nr:Phosphatidylinositolglycan class N-domain-containing protein [Cristinia sonorae]